MTCCSLSEFRTPLLCTASDAALLAVVLDFRNHKDACATAERLLGAAGSLQRIGGMSPAAMAKVPGMSRRRIQKVRAAVELGRRALTTPLSRNRPLRSSADVVAALAPRMRGERVEALRVVALDAGNRPLFDWVANLGTPYECVVHVGEVLRVLLEHGADAFVVLHNHPAGSPVPTEKDRRLTFAMQQGAELLGLRLLDHIIVGESSSYSFLADQGELEPQGPPLPSNLDSP